jgi:Gas vesicle synthesis protein GvpL/GvpF
MDDELARWAALRAPELIARAEAQAVAVLRDALVAAVRREEGDDAIVNERGGPPTRPAAEGDLVWAYCVVAADDATPSEIVGVAGGRVERIEAGGLAVLTGHVPAAQFTAEPLREHLNDLAWLEEVARAHEAVLEQAFATATIVPLRLCTLYETQDGARRMLEREQATLRRALDRLAGLQEWGVKLIVDPGLLAAAARAASSQSATYEQELEQRTGGGAYMLRRRFERHVRECTDALAAEVAESVHGSLADWAIDAVTRPAQNRDLSGHQGEMLLNGAYLLDARRTDDLRALVTDLEERHRDLGARIELTGPWPPFNFVEATFA